MARISLCGFALFVAALFLPFVSNAAECTAHDGLVNSLKQKYGETRVAVGLRSSGAVIEVFVATNGTWTIISTSPYGVSCVVAAGEEWQRISPTQGEDS